MYSGRRLVPAPTTLLHAKAWVEPAGIQSVRDISAADCLGIPVFVSERPASAAHRYGFGKGLLPIHAEIGAYMEAIESYLCEPGIAPIETKHGGIEEISGVAGGGDPIMEFAPRLGLTPEPDRKLLLAAAQDMERGTKHWVPAELVFSPAPPGTGPSLYGASSNGLASGNSLLEACLHALYELIERDIWSIEFIRNRAALLDPSDLPRYVQNIIRNAAQHGIHSVIRYVPNDYGIAFFAAFLFEPDRPERGRFNGGWGCHHSRNVALLRAVTETAQSRCVYRAGLGRLDISAVSRAEADRVNQQIAAISARTPSIRYEDIPDLPATAGLPKQWAAAVSALRRVSDRPIFRLIYTPVQSPLQVVRLIVPLLEHFTPSTKRMGPRMQAELEALAGKTNFAQRNEFSG